MKIMLRFSRAKISMVSFMAALTLMIFTVHVSANEITVNDFIALKNAVQTASEGDSIIIGGSFAFPETLIIDKSLTFTAVNPVALTVTGDFRHMDVRAYGGGDITLEFFDVALIGRKLSPSDTTRGGGIVITRTEGHPSTANKSNTINTLHLVNPVIQNCHNGSYGGGIGFTWPQGQPEIDYCNLGISGDKTDISYNSANRGGGISANHITINGGAIQNNAADVWAGGAYAYGGLTMNGGTLSGNTAGSYGGGSANYHGDYTINGGTIRDNAAGEAGGGIYAGNYLTMNGGNIEGNRTDGFGGGICAGAAEINKGRISGNTASADGGGIVCFQQMKMSSGEISGNSAGQDGGGIFSYYFEGYSKDSIITGGYVSDNTAARNGGGLYTEGGVSITGAVFDGNASVQNGGGLCVYKGKVKITDSAVSGNTAELDGAGVWIDDLSRLTTDRVVFGNNKAREGYIWDVDNPSDEEQAADALIHKSNILATAYTEPFTNAYSNYDVNYASGALLSEHITGEEGANNNGGGIVGNEDGIIGDENGIIETENGVAGTEYYITESRIYGTPNVRSELIINEPELGRVERAAEEEILPLAPKPGIIPVPETHPNTGSPEGFALTAALILCAGAVCLTVFNKKM